MTKSSGFQEVWVGDYDLSYSASPHSVCELPNDPSAPIVALSAGESSTTTSACVDLPPPELSSSEATSDSLTVRWSEVASPFIDETVTYEVRLDDGTATVPNEPDGADTRSHRFSGLSAGTSYKVQARALSAGFESAWSDPLTVWTLLPTPTISVIEVAVTASAVTFSWSAVTGADGYKVRIDAADSVVPELSGGITPVPVGGLGSRSHRFTGLRPSTEYTLRVRAVNANTTSAWATYTITTLAAPPVSLTASVSPSSCSVGGEVTLSWAISGGAAPFSLSLDGTSIVNSTSERTGSHALACLTVGAQTATLTVTDSSATPLSDSATVSWSVVELSLTASVSPTTCETGGTVSVDWAATGGVKPYTVTVDGTTQTASPTSVTCQSTAGEQTIAVSVTDSSSPPETISRTLTVSVTSPPVTLTGELLAQRLASGKVEFVFRTSDGTKREPKQRFLDPATVTAGKWYNSSSFTIEIDQTTYTVGQISAKLVNTSCPHYFDVTLLTTSGTRLVPTPNNFEYRRATAGVWYVSGDLSITLSTAAANALTGLSASVEQWSMTTGETEVSAHSLAERPMSAEAASGLLAAVAASADGSATAQVALCAPWGLSVSGKTQNSLTLNWSDVPEATKYEVKRSGSTSTETKTTTSHTFSGLTADTEYTLYVRSKNATQTSASWSQTKASTLPSPPPKPAPVVTTEKVGRTTVDNEWRLYADGIPGAYPPNPPGSCYWEYWQQDRYALADFETDWKWDASAWKWVLDPSTKRQVGVESDYIYEWYYTGTRYDCPPSTGEDKPPAPPTRGLPPGDHLMAWDGDWFSFTVPVGAELTLERRTVEGQAATAFSRAGGTEIEVIPARLELNPPITENPTLAAIVTSFWAETEPAKLLPAAERHTCAESPPHAEGGALSLDLDAQWCTVVRGGGELTARWGDSQLSLNLPSGRTWVVLSAAQSQSTEAAGIWIIEWQSKSHLILDPATGVELSRRLTEGADGLSAVLDTVTKAAKGDRLITT